MKGLTWHPLGPAMMVSGVVHLWPKSPLLLGLMSAHFDFLLADLLDEEIESLKTLIEKYDAKIDLLERKLAN